MNKKTGFGALVAIAIVVAGVLGIKVPEPIANMLQQHAGIELPDNIVSGRSANSTPDQPPRGNGGQAVSSESNNESGNESGSESVSRGMDSLDGPIKVARDFREAKRWLYAIHDDRRVDFYCGCGYDRSRRNIDTSSCGYKIKEDQQRGRRIEAEHVIPASWLGKPRACWDLPNCRNDRGEQVNGRDCCLATDNDFRIAHNDLVNLMPTVGELNKHRSSYPFGEVRGEPREYGSCNFEKGGRGPIEPPDDVKGDIARIAFYMRDRYNADIRSKQLALMKKWDRQDPVSDWERLRNQRVAAKQGSGNPYVASP